jgi:hypothetical protein
MLYLVNVANFVVGELYHGWMSLEREHYVQFSIYQTKQAHDFILHNKVRKVLVL